VTGVFVIGAIVLIELGARWTHVWHAPVVQRSGIFCYRTLASTGSWRTARGLDAIR
jgi:hypothetical protein